MLTVAAVLACMLVGGCGGVDKVWSSTSPSPDGRWLAVAHTERYSGPGNNGVATIVEIQQKTFFDRSIMVLGFEDDGRSMELTMNWVTPHHLEVVFKDDPKVIYFQVVKTSGVEVSVRDLSGASSSCP
jgi:hypothetical protein